LLAVSCPYINLPTVKHSSISTFKKIYDLNKRDKGYVVYFFGGTSMFDREMLLSIGGLEGKYFIYLEEEDLALRAFLKGQYFKVLYGHNFIAIHDQAPGKNFYERNIYLLSNRFIFHYKFMSSSLVLNFFNFLYVLVYLVKTRSFDTVSKSLSRYKSIRTNFVRHKVSIHVMIRFFLKRFF